MMSPRETVMKATWFLTITPPQFEAVIAGVGVS
jgi:hypothetical protein